MRPAGVHPPHRLVTCVPSPPNPSGGGGGISLRLLHNGSAGPWSSTSSRRGGVSAVGMAATAMARAIVGVVDVAVRDPDRDSDGTDDHDDEEEAAEHWDYVERYCFDAALERPRPAISSSSSQAPTDVTQEGQGRQGGSSTTTSP
jgi:hypothetical protein